MAGEGGGFGGFGGGGEGGGGFGGLPVGAEALSAAKRRRAALAVSMLRRKRRVLAPIGAAASGPLESSVATKVVIQTDFPNVVGSSTGSEAEIVRDADGKMRFYLPPGILGALKWKQSVKAATTANGTLATAFENGDTIDGIVLTTGDRILLKNQSTGSQNGIYIVQASGAPVRAPDANVGSYLVHAVVGVEQGTSNSDKFFVCFNNSPITLESTSINWGTLVNFIGSIPGSLIDDGSVDILKLLGSGLSTGAMLYCDGSQWIVLEPPGALSALKHDGAAPFWDPV